jgi:hypothetical protein
MNASPMWVERAAVQDADRLSDALNYAERKSLVIEDADFRTRAARAEIAKLAQSLTEQETCAIVSSLIAAVDKSPFSHHEAGVTAMEYLLDVHHCLENAQ